MIAQPVLLVAGVMVILACGSAAAALLADARLPLLLQRSPRLAQLERERDIAAALGWPWRSWVGLRFGLLAVALALALPTGVWSFTLILAVIAVAGVRFAVAGRAARRRLRMERAFLALLRDVRDRMAISNQSLDTALLQIAAAPPRELARILDPLTHGGLITDALVACAQRSRSPLVEQACCVLIWARPRSLDALIAAIDEVLLPVGEAQLAVEEESLVTLTQQRAVSFAMAALLLIMFVSIVRVDSFRAYYQSLPGNVVLLVVVVLFTALLGVLGRISRVVSWSRWDLRRLAQLEEAADG